MTDDEYRIVDERPAQKVPVNNIRFDLGRTSENKVRFSIVNGTTRIQIDWTPDAAQELVSVIQRIIDDCRKGMN